MLNQPKDLKDRVEAITVAVPVKIETAEEYTKAAAQRYGARVLLAEIDSTFDPLIRKAQESVTAIRATKTGLAEPLTGTITRIDIALSIYERGQAAKKAQDESRLIVQAAKQDEAQRQQEVKNLARSGYIKEAAKLAEAPLPPPMVPVVQVDIPKVAGLSKRENWSAVVRDMKKLVAGICAGKTPFEAVKPNLPFLNAIARSSKSAMAIPGVDAVNNPVRSQRK